MEIDHAAFMRTCWPMMPPRRCRNYQLLDFLRMHSSKKDIFKLHRSLLSLLVILLLSLSASQAADSRLDDRYVDLISSADLVAAFEHVSQGTDREARLVTAYHLMSGSGVPQNECAAVRILEQLVRHDLKLDRAKSALNLIYGGGWAAIASREGSAKAALHLGIYYLNLSENNVFDAIGAEKYDDEKAFLNLLIAEKLGSNEASEFLAEIDISDERKEFVEAQVPKTLNAIVCPEREQGHIQ